MYLRSNSCKYIMRAWQETVETFTRRPNLSFSPRISTLNRAKKDRQKTGVVMLEKSRTIEVQILQKVKTVRK